jgi:pimeloyl-ACP methyl ester carboxylesterase
LSPRDFVLVHGAWHGGWCWDLVRERIEAAGHRVHTPTLPGLGDRAGELDAATGLADHIADVADHIAARDMRDIVLAGHSYGGMVITGVADALKSRIAHILYLDAALPEDGESMISYGAPRPPEAIAATEAALRSLAPDGIAMAAFPPALLGMPEGHRLHDHVAARLTPHPLKTWLDPIRLVNGGPAGLPRTYVHCTAPVMTHTQFPTIARMAKADAAWRYAELATGHEAMLTAPDAVAKLLLDTLASLRNLSAQSPEAEATAQEQA